MTEPGSQAERRVSHLLPPAAQEALKSKLSPSDLSTLLLSVARARASRVAPAEIVRRWHSDRFVRPATTNPRALAPLEAELWRLLPDDFRGVELSPVTPLGTSTAVSPISQNRVLGTMRGTEVVSDSTTVLAVEAAIMRREQGRAGEVHLAASHRLLRAQMFGPGQGAHFKLFALVSSARDAGDARTETRLLTKHIRWWLDALSYLIPTTPPRVDLTFWPDGRVAHQVRDAVLKWVERESLEAFVFEDSERQYGRGYYEGIALRVSVTDGTVELGDGGMTNWTSLLMGDAKERCMVSCIATERLLQQITAAR